MRITEFLEPFFEENETIYGRALKAKNYDGFDAGAREFEFSRDSLKSDKSLQTELKDFNRTRGIYFVVNEGGGSDILINRINAVFCEIDDIPIQDQHDTFDNAPYPPSIRLETRKSVHAYWLLNEQLLPNEFIQRQKGLIKFFKSDKGICNPARLMRLPFFNHVYFDKSRGEFEYKKIEVHTFNPDSRFSFSEIADAYPYTPPPRPKPTKFDNFTDDNLTAAHLELINRITLTPNYHRSGHFGYTNGVCHNGQESDTALYINFNTNFVGCFAGCTYKEIADAFAINFKKEKN